MGKLLPTPYGLRETLGVLGRMVTGPRSANPAAVESLPEESRLNPVQPGARIAFVGDVMATSAALLGRRHTLRRRLYPLEVGDGLVAAVAGCDALVANFEGVLSDRPRFFVDQAHHPSILESLAKLFPPARTFLCLANNHAADFGRAAFDATVDALGRAGFVVFGTAARPAAEVAPGVTVVGGTAWSNRPCDFVARLDQSAGAARPGHANVLFPHWGFELEAFPRRDTVALAGRLAEQFEAIVGHHSHTPQPVSALAGADGRVRPVAYSLGNFCFGNAVAHYSSGLLLTLEVGKTGDGRWAAGELRWSPLQCRHEADAVRVELGEAKGGA